MELMISGWSEGGGGVWGILIHTLSEDNFLNYICYNKALITTNFSVGNEHFTKEKHQCLTKMCNFLVQ
jgi:hypothetical protein